MISYSIKQKMEGRINMPRRAICILMLLMSIVLSCTAEDDITTFSTQNGYTVVLNAGLLGLENELGNTIIPTEYTGIFPIQHGYCIVSKDSKFGVWSCEGVEILQSVFDSILLGTKAWVVAKDNKALLFDPVTNAIVSKRYDLIRPTISQDLFWCSTTLGDKRGVGLLFSSGEEILPCIYNDVVVSSSRIIELVDEDYRVRYFNLETMEFLCGEYHWGTSFSRGFAAVGLGNEDGACLINDQGLLSSPVFEDISLDYCDGFFACKENGKWFIRDVESPNENLDGPYMNEPYYIGHGLFSIVDGKRMLVFSSGDKQKREIENIDAITNFDGLAAWTINGVRTSHPLYGYFFDDFSTIPAVFSDGLSFIGGFTFVKIEDTWYAMDKKGMVDFDLCFTDVFVYQWYSCFVARAGNYYLFLDNNLKPITMVDSL